jgi:hypothetical protein
MSAACDTLADDVKGALLSVLDQGCEEVLLPFLQLRRRSDGEHLATASFNLAQAAELACIVGVATAHRVAEVSADASADVPAADEMLHIINPTAGMASAEAQRQTGLDRGAALVHRSARARSRSPPVR